MIDLSVVSFDFGFAWLKGLLLVYALTGSVAALGKGQKSECASGEARGGGLGALMRFAFGQAYESVDGKNHAVVTQIRSDGREGLLRINGGREEWFL
jgi:hypothetical protein